MVLIKDNHVSIAGGITKALKSTDDYLVQNNLVMEVEVVFFLQLSLPCLTPSLVLLQYTKYSKLHTLF